MANVVSLFVRNVNRLNLQQSPPLAPKIITWFNFHLISNDSVRTCFSVIKHGHLTIKHPLPICHSLALILRDVAMHGVIWHVGMGQSTFGNCLFKKFGVRGNTANRCYLPNNPHNKYHEQKSHPVEQDFCGLFHHASMSAFKAFSSIKTRRGSTSSPIRQLNRRSASIASSIVILSMWRVSGFMVVSQSWSAFISPKPL